MEYYNALCPYNQNDIIEVRQSEPYSYCQFIMGPDHSAYGRARHPFMTGSGGWSYFAATRYLLGIMPDYDQLVADPCIPKSWDCFQVVRKWRGGVYVITVENPDHVCKGVKRIEIDGKESKKNTGAAGRRHSKGAGDPGERVTSRVHSGKSKEFERLYHLQEYRRHKAKQGISWGKCAVNRSILPEALHRRQKREDICAPTGDWR